MSHQAFSRLEVQLHFTGGLRVEMRAQVGSLHRTEEPAQIGRPRFQGSTQQPEHARIELSGLEVVGTNSIAEMRRQLGPDAAGAGAAARQGLLAADLLPAALQRLGALPDVSGEVSPQTPKRSMSTRRNAEALT